MEVPPESHKNPDYGFSVGRGAFKFPKGAWTTIAERVKLNTVGKADGQFIHWKRIVFGVQSVLITNHLR